MTESNTCGGDPHRAGAPARGWRAGLVGAEDYVTSCELLIFVDQTTEPITPMNLPDGRPQQPNHAAIGCLLIQRPVQSVPVEVIDVLGQHLLAMPSVDDQHQVQARST